MNAIRYNFVFYENTILLNFVELMQRSKGKNISSVLYAFIYHDKDVIEATGEIKKPHYHLWVEFPCAVKDRDLINLLILSGSNESAMAHQKTDRNFLAYLTHDTINSQLKARYKLEDIITNIEENTFNEWYYEAISKVNKPSRHSLRVKENASYIEEITEIIRANHSINSFTELVIYLSSEGLFDLLNYVSSKAYFSKLAFQGLFDFNLKHKLSYNEYLMLLTDKNENNEDLEALGQ